MATPKHDIGQEIELAKMMVADIDRIYKKYAKAALKAAEERTEKIRVESYHGCENLEELQNIYGFGDLTRDEYEKGVAFFESREERQNQRSLIERHRQNLKDIRDKWKGTVKELQDELDEIDGVVKDNRTYLEKLEAEERQERCKMLS